MDNYIIRVVFNHSIIIAVIIAMIRFKSIISDYYPFIFVIWLGLVNESLSLIMIYSTRSNAINSNVFVLLEYGLILFQFYKWNDSNSKKYYLLAGLGLLIWIADNFIINSIAQNNSLFRVFYSFVIVFFSIDQVNKMIIYEKGVLLKNAMFIICITFLFYYGCKAFVEAFNVFHSALSNMLLKNLWIILYFVNVIANVLYALAILCLPTKQKFTLPY